MLRQCAWCLRVFKNGKWVDGVKSKLPGATHGMCADCKEVCLREFEEYRKAA